MFKGMGKADQKQGTKKCILGKPTTSAAPNVHCAQYIFAPTRGATQQIVDWESLTPTQGATQQSVDCESLTPTQGAMQESVDWESLTQPQGATQ